MADSPRTERLPALLVPYRGAPRRGLARSLGNDTRRRFIMTDARNAASTNVVLVHGGFVDGSGWEAVHRILLVYIAAFAPDKGESVSSLIKDPPPGAPIPPILPPQDGYLFLDKTKFHASFAA